MSLRDRGSGCRHWAFFYYCQHQQLIQLAIQSHTDILGWYGGMRFSKKEDVGSINFVGWVGWATDQTSSIEFRSCSIHVWNSSCTFHFGFWFPFKFWEEVLLAKLCQNFPLFPGLTFRECGYRSWRGSVHPCKHLYQSSLQWSGPPPGEVHLTL